MRESSIRLLILYAGYETRLSYFDDWLDALRAYQGFRSVCVDIVPAGASTAIRRHLTNVDAVVLMHSTNGDTTSYLKRHLGVLTERNVPLVSFVGNEVNLPGSPIADKRSVFAAIRPEWIATQLLEEAGNFLFGDLTSRGVAMIPHALNPSAFYPTRPIDDRPIDIGARLARYPPHLGDDDRNRLVDRFVHLGRERSIRIDISDERYDRAGWAEFLNRCCGTVATEAGSWFLERDDRTVNAVRDYILAGQGGIVIRNDSIFRELGHRLPWRLRAALRQMLRSGRFRHEAVVNETVSFNEIFERFFVMKERPPFYGKCISSRHFEAIGTKTCQIMFPGRFNDILTAGRHYIAVDQNFGNLDQALEQFFDLGHRRSIAEAAYAHVMDGHTYEHRMRQVYALLQDSQRQHAL